jgi:predicted DNA binding CopG/RHH family protein
MQPEPNAPSSSYEDSFAGLLAAFAAPAKKTPPETDVYGADDDVVSLSYEQALRSRTSFRTELQTIEPVRPPDGATPRISSRNLSDHSDSTADSRAISGAARASVPPATRSSSVTIRLSASESERLHLRAAEAGLTVSAYLRSCAFEVESLRSEVKSTLATLRSKSAPDQTTLGKPKLDELPLNHRSTWRRFFPRCFSAKNAHSKPRL